jgi:hypothetical protein
MCMACEMEAMWFAAMEARARAVAAEAVPQADLLPLPEGGRVGEGAGARGESASSLPRDNSQGELRGPPPEEGGGSTAPPTFACVETQAE